MLEEIVYVLMNELFDVDGMDEDLVDELCSCVKEVLMMIVLVKEELFEGFEFVEDLFVLVGLECDMVFKLVVKGVVILEDLVD